MNETFMSEVFRLRHYFPKRRGKMLLTKVSGSGLRVHGSAVITIGYIKLRPEIGHAFILTHRVKMLGGFIDMFCLNLNLSAIINLEP